MCQGGQGFRAVIYETVSSRLASLGGGKQEAPALTGHRGFHRFKSFPTASAESLGAPVRRGIRKATSRIAMRKNRSSKNVI